MVLAQPTIQFNNMTTVNLTKVPKVNLTKGQTVNLTKDGTASTTGLQQVFFGAKWGSIIHGRKPVKAGGFLSRLFSGVRNAITEAVSSIEDVDLDASLLLFDKNYNLVDTVYFGHKRSSDGAIIHSGDDLTGTAGAERDNDNETISINLPAINSRVEYIVAILNSYCHHKFDEIPYMKLRIYTGRAGKPDEVLCAYNVENNDSFKGKEAIILGHLYRSPEGWKFRADGRTTNERSISDIAHGSAERLLRNL